MKADAIEFNLVTGNCLNRRLLISRSRAPPNSTPYCFMCLYHIHIHLHGCPRCHSIPRRFSTANSQRSEFHEESESAYDILGVSFNSSFDEIKASFRKLAKETHPDLAGSDSSSKRFLQIVAAYEILSDPLKRAHYDEHLLAQRKVAEEELNFHNNGSSYRMYPTTSANQIEVVQWLRWYRSAVKQILSEKNMIGGTSYFDVLQRDFHSAVHHAYYGPELNAINLLPDRFEAEERSVPCTPEVLHLVSGRTLFGAVCIADEIPKLSTLNFRRLAANGPLDSNAKGALDGLKSLAMEGKCGGRESVQMTAGHAEDDAYSNLELHVFGKLVATATRVLRCSEGMKNEDCQDEINVFHCSPKQTLQANREFARSSWGDKEASATPLGRIVGLGTDAEENYCYVYNKSGAKTHVILKHRTLLVKHLHWFQLGDDVSICECRCTRARLPPSKYWLFEPRCSMHDIGGWYVETYGLDKKRHNAPTQRYWDGFESVQKSKKQLHPAVYLLALAYRTLDLENAKRKKQPMRNAIAGHLSRIFGWCKKLI